MIRIFSFSNPTEQITLYNSKYYIFLKIFHGFNYGRTEMEGLNHNKVNHRHLLKALIRDDSLH